MGVNRALGHPRAPAPKGPGKGGEIEALIGYSLARNSGTLPQTLVAPTRRPLKELGSRDDDGEQEVKWDVSVHPTPVGSVGVMSSPKRLRSQLPRPEWAKR